MPAGYSTSAPIARGSSNPKKAIAAYFVVMAACLVHRFKRMAPAEGTIKKGPPVNRQPGY
ncbi:hypothetical protein HY58_00600 [Flavihumibacter sp. ZG627]|nr:hypothetical protein HY58_00600 [Flavihumibacter sp. ZG627]